MTTSVKILSASFVFFIFLRVGGGVRGLHSAAIQQKNCNICGLQLANLKFHSIIKSFSSHAFAGIATEIKYAKKSRTSTELKLLKILIF